MNRKHFFAKLLPATLAGLWSKELLAFPAEHPHAGKIPRYLKKGDTIGITCPASPMELGDVKYCVEALHGWGYKVRFGKTIGLHWQRFAGTDEERAADLQHMLDDREIDAILFGCGGYGVMRIIDKINWKKFAAKPKWLIGFSDITAFHCHINTVFGIPTIHADMANGFGGSLDNSAFTLKEAMEGKRTSYELPNHMKNRTGSDKGQLVGGNLSLICAMQGSKSELNTEGKILFIEDRGEYKYNIDRMMMNLKRGGKLSKLAGLVVGAFTASKESEEITYTMTVEEIIYEKVKEYGYPVCFNLPAGHQTENWALKLGLHYHLNVQNNGSWLKEVKTSSQTPLKKVQVGTTPVLDSVKTDNK